MPGLGVIGNLVVLKACLSEDVHGAGEEGNVLFGVFLKFPFVQAFEEFGVFLVVEIVGRDVIGAEVHCIFQVCQPTLR